VLCAMLTPVMTKRLTLPRNIRKLRFRWWSKGVSI
jgi:hypothetical protein